MADRRSLRVNLISVLALALLLGVLWLTPEFRGFLGWVESRIPKPAPPVPEAPAEPEELAAKEEAAEEEALPPHVERAEDGSLVPESGYRWVSEDNDDYTVVWCPGCLHRVYPHVVASETEGRFRPAPGYEWANPEGVNDQSTVWKPGTPHPRYEHVVADEKEGSWVPAPGHDWASQEPDDYSVVPEPPPS